MLNLTEHEVIMLIKVKMPTIDGILTFISMIKTTSESLRRLFQHFRVLLAQVLSLECIPKKKKFLISEPKHVVGTQKNRLNVTVIEMVL